MLHTHSRAAARGRSKSLEELTEAPRNRGPETGPRGADSRWRPGRILASSGVMGGMDWSLGVDGQEELRASNAPCQWN